MPKENSERRLARQVELNISILVPELTKPGGVASYYAAIQPYLPEHVSYFTRGVRSFPVPLPWFLIYLADYVVFFLTVAVRTIQRKPYIYLINTSMAKVGCTRDSVFLLVLNLFRQPYLVFFRGWDESAEPWFAQRVRGSMGVYFKSKRLIVLSQDIREKLKRWGYEGPIELENTVVDDRLLADVSNQGRTGMTLLFMSRIERSKGVFDCIDAYQTLKVTIPDLRLIIAGVGSDLARVRELCDQDPMISTPGYLTGIGKTQAFLASDLFLFPSTHGEGMPNVVLEAMALGLPVLTTPCSGIKDFFEPGVMGEYLEGDLVESIVKNVELLNSDKSMLETMASFNRSYARAHFLASKTASRLVGYVESSFKENHA